MMKNYLLNLLQQCSEEEFGQDAIEWAIFSGRLHLSYELENDVREIMSNYDDIIEAYRRRDPQFLEAHRKSRAPMKRAVPGRKPKTASSGTAVERKSAAA